MSSPEQTVSITHQSTGKGGKYIATLADSPATGYLEWEPHASDNVRIATHTIVPDAIGGRGIAAMLVDALIADARQQGFKVVPQCWYVARKFDKNPDWADLRA